MSTVTSVQPEVVQGTTTSWLPITTAYPSVSGCVDALILYPQQPFPVGWDPGYGYYASGSLSCLPPEVTKSWQLEIEKPDQYARLSIQPITCPEAYTTAATEVRASSSTLVKCCPAGYYLSGGQPGQIIGDCFTSLTPGQTITYSAQTTSSSWAPQEFIVFTPLSMFGMAIVGYNVAHAGSTPASTPPSITFQRSSSQTTQTSMTAPSATSATGPPSTHGLSSGAAAAIGSGVTLAIIGFSGLALWLFRRTRKRRGVHNDKVLKTELDSKAMSEVQSRNASSHEMYVQPAELGVR